MQAYQSDFIDFLISSKALNFGDFILKSGRKAPYFINTGKFETGEHLAKLANFYASRIASLNVGKLDVIFGPAYKGIPLAVAAAMALYTEHGLSLSYAFDRKEIKDHGDKGKIVGHKFQPGERVVIVEDVITAGTTLREVVPMLKALAPIEIVGVVISVDRCERGSGTLSAAKETELELGVPVFQIVTIHEIVEHLSSPNSSGFTLEAAMQERIRAYLAEYGA